MSKQLYTRGKNLLTTDEVIDLMQTTSKERGKGKSKEE